MMDNYDSMIGLFKNATGHLNEEEFEELDFDFEQLSDHQDISNNAWDSVQAAINALEIEDPLIA